MLKYVTLTAALAITLAGISMPTAIAAQTSSAAERPGRPQVVTRRVWQGPNFDGMGEPSPNGRFYTYTDWVNANLAIHEFATGKNRHLTTDGSWVKSEWPEYSVFSPDGASVAYNWFSSDWVYELRTVSLDGSGPRTVYHDPEVFYVMPTDWSPDGRTILASLVYEGGASQIVLIDVESGSARPLKSFDWRWPGNPRFSPDGRFIAYDFPPDEDSDKRDIFVLAVDGSGETKLEADRGDDLFYGWTPDGSHILFASDRSGTIGAWIVPVAGGRASGEPRLVKPDLWRAFPGGFSDDGTYYYGVAIGARDVHVATVDFEVAEVIAPPTPAVQRRPKQNSSPAWSPDGRSMAFLTWSIRSAVTTPSTLAIASVETGEVREIGLRGEFTYFTRPRWTPDGRSIMVTARDRKNRQKLAVVDIQSGDVTFLPDPAVFVHGTPWSDGDVLVYEGADMTVKNEAIYVRDLASGEERRIYVGDPLSNLALSPDGRTVAFSTSKLGIVTLPVEGGEPSAVVTASNSRLPIKSIAWTPDGRRLVYGMATGVQDQTTELWVVDSGGGEPRRLGIRAEGIRTLSVHPDGRRIAFSAGERSAELWVLENLDEVVRAATR